MEQVLPLFLWSLVLSLIVGFLWWKFDSLKTLDKVKDNTMKEMRNLIHQMDDRILTYQNKVKQLEKTVELYQEEEERLDD